MGGDAGELSEEVWSAPVLVVRGGFSLAYRRILAGVGALLLFAAVQVTMIGAGPLGDQAT